MPANFNRPSPVDVTKTNPVEFIYIKGDANTDGSMRLVFDNARFTTNLEKRVAGVWNLGALRVGGESIIFGVNLAGTAEGRFWVVADSSTLTRNFMPGFEVEDSGSKPARVAVFGVTNVRFVTQPINTFEFTKAAWPSIITLPFSSLTYKIYLQTGTTAPVDELTFILRLDDEFGATVHSQIFPASQFPANSEVELIMNPPFDFTANQPFFSTLISDTAFTLKTDATEDAFFALDFQIYQLEDLISTPLGTDRFLIDNAGDVIADNSGNLILDGAAV